MYTMVIKMRMISLVTKKMAIMVMKIIMIQWLDRL